MKILAAAASLLALVSCSTVVSVQPVGSRPADLGKLKLEGTWANEEDGEKAAFLIKDAKMGTVVMFSGEEEIELHVRQTGNMVFANLEDEESGHYSWAALDIRDDVLQVRIPDFDQFADLVRQGKVHGRLIENEDIDEEGRIIKSGTDVLMDDPAQKWVTDLVAGKLGNVFNPDDGSTMKRVRGPIP